MGLDLTPSGEDHWHDFAASVYVVEGSVKITVRDLGQSCELMPGDSITAGPGAVHREEGEPYRAVVAFHQDPSDLTMPIDKPPVDA
jgi:quercetin dioxygenase-like cupin family protein